MCLGMHHCAQRAPSRQNLRYIAGDARLSLSLELRAQWPNFHGSRGNADALLCLSTTGAPLDREPRWSKIAHHLPERQAVASDVSLVLIEGSKEPVFRLQPVCPTAVEVQSQCGRTEP